MQQAPTIPPEVARHVLWMYGREGGWQPGSFTQHLLRAFAAADIINFARLAHAYPDYGHAVTIAQYDPHGVLVLEDAARGAA